MEGGIRPGEPVGSVAQGVNRSKADDTVEGEAERLAEMLTQDLGSAAPLPVPSHAHRAFIA